MSTTTPLSCVAAVASAARSTGAADVVCTIGVPLSATPRDGTADTDRVRRPPGPRGEGSYRRRRSCSAAPERVGRRTTENLSVVTGSCGGSSSRARRTRLPGAEFTAGTTGGGVQLRDGERREPDARRDDRRERRDVGRRAQRVHHRSHVEDDEAEQAEACKPVADAARPQRQQREAICRRRAGGIRIPRNPRPLVPPDPNPKRRSYASRDKISSRKLESFIPHSGFFGQIASGFSGAETVRG